MGRLEDEEESISFGRNITGSNIPDEHRGGLVILMSQFKTEAVGFELDLIWPVLLIAVKPKRAGAAAFLLAMTVAAWRTVVGHFELWPGILIPSNLLARTDAKIDALLWGCIAAIYFPAIKRYVEGIRFTQLWLPIVAILLVVEKLHLPGLVVLQAVLIPALVLSTVIQSGNLLGRFLEWQPLRWIGTISYSLYLWQEIFLPMVEGSEKLRGPFPMPSTTAVECPSHPGVRLSKPLPHRTSYDPARTPPKRKSYRIGYSANSLPRGRRRLVLMPR
jgi:hypothetical protein